MLTIPPIVKILWHSYTLNDSFRIQLSTSFLLSYPISLNRVRILEIVNKEIFNFFFFFVKSFQLVRLDKLLGDNVTAAVLVVITSLQALTLNIPFTHRILCLAIGKRH